MFPNNPIYNRVITAEELLSWKRLELSRAKLELVLEYAGILAAFSVVVTVELQINEEDAHPILLTAFAITTSLLVAGSTLALLIAGCILPRIEMTAKLRDNVYSSPHESLNFSINVAFILSNTVCTFLFTLDVILMCWIKFTIFTKAAPIAATIIMGSVLIIIAVFGVVFYRTLIKQSYETSHQKYLELETMHNTINKLSRASTPKNLSMRSLSESLSLSSMLSRQNLNRDSAKSNSSVYIV